MILADPTGGFLRSANPRHPVFLSKYRQLPFFRTRSVAGSDPRPRRHRVFLNNDRQLPFFRTRLVAGSDPRPRGLRAFLSNNR